MKLHFYKYQGAGNDFVIVDGRTVMPQLSQKEIYYLCDRRFGIGADGLMVIGNAPDVDFTMRYYNANGKEGSMCGNGGRCLVAYAANGKVGRYQFSAVDGLHHAEVRGHRGSEALVCLGMNDVDKVHCSDNDRFFMDTGSPHLVIFEPDIANLDARERGAFWRHHPDFAPGGTNVNFVEVEPDGKLFVRTFERGVEDETLACGTGVTASAIAAYMRSLDKDIDESGKPHDYAIRTLGGNLQVSFLTKGALFYDVKLTGPTTFVFEGEIELI
ncbi:MAG: diaminopimelate epimerase [Bacteroidales bacterium]|nr:diaminopimelate epimerase [Bacteroidales bacterium]